MQTIEITFAAGDTAELAGGNFFQYLRGQDPIEVQFWRGSAILNNESAGKARPGYVAEPPRRVPRGQSEGEPVGFTAVQLKSATAQTIEIGISEGEGGYNRFTGESEIIGPLDGAGRIQVAEDQYIRVGSRLFQINESFQLVHGVEASGSAGDEQRYTPLNGRLLVCEGVSVAPQGSIWGQLTVGQALIVAAGLQALNKANPASDSSVIGHESGSAQGPQLAQFDIADAGVYALNVGPFVLDGDNTDILCVGEFEGTNSFDWWATFHDVTEV